MAPSLQYCCLENPMDGGAWQAAVHGVAKSRTRLSDFTFTFLHWRRKWQPMPVFLPGESQGQGSLVGCRLWGRTESDTTEATQQQQQQQVGHSFSSKEQASFNFMAAVTICSGFGAKKIKSLTVCTVSPSICHELIGLGAMILVFLMLSLKAAFSLFSFLNQEALQFLFALVTLNSL